MTMADITDCTIGRRVRIAADGTTKNAVIIGRRMNNVVEGDFSPTTETASSLSSGPDMVALQVDVPDTIGVWLTSQATYFPTNLSDNLA